MRDRAGHGYPSGVMTHRSVRRTFTVLSTTAVMVLGLPLIAMADEPTAWPDAPHVSGLKFLLVLFLIPLGLSLAISVLAVLPSLISDKGYQPGQAWRSEAEWFGGPSKGVTATDDASSEDLENDQGGTSARW